MSYTKTQWNNDTAPAINETNLNKIEQGIYDNDSHIGDLSDLETTANTDLVSAINENVSSIGDLSDLTTTANTDLVSAINELDDLKATKDVATTSANGLMSSTDKINLTNYVDGLVKTPLTTNLTTSFNNQANGTTNTYRYQNGATDSPDTTAGGIVISFRDTADWGWQIAIYNSIMAKRQKKQGTWGAWIDDGVTTTQVTPNSTYFNAGDIDHNVVHKTGHVVEVLFRGKLKANFPNNAVLFTMPYAPVWQITAMFGYGERYGFDQSNGVRWCYVDSQRNLKTGGLTAGKYVHVDIVYITNS